MKHILVIVADTNDADYVTETSEITPEQLEALLPVFDAIKNFQPYEGSNGRYSTTHRHNWPYGTGEYVPRKDLGEKWPWEIYAGLITKEQAELFNEFAPFGEYGIHTIKSIKVLVVESETTYYEHKY